jgi:NADH-quinone oxidoreductase subunit B
MGACSISGGPFKQGYNVLKGVDRYIPVDIYIPGCPPRPEALLNGLIELQKRIHAERLTGDVGVPRHLRKNDEVVSEWPVPAFGEHDLVPPRNDALTQRSEPLVRG